MALRYWLRRAAVAGMLVPLGCLTAVPSDAVSAVRVVFIHARYHASYLRAGIEVQNISASGPKAAWAIGFRVNAAGNATSGFVMRYNGRGWATVPYPGERSFFPESVTALSATDVWIFGLHQGLAYGALHYSHGTWRSFPTPADSQDAWLVLSDTDIWVAAGPLQIPGCYSYQFGPGCSAAAHWNGKNWHYYPIAVANLTDLAGSSAADIWAAGYDEVHTRSPDYVQPFVFRWTGSAFRRANLRLMRTNYLPLLTVLSPRNVWLTGPTPKHRGEISDCVTHWNGRRWAIFLPVYVGCEEIISDRHGGVWLSSDQHWTGSELVQYAPLNAPGGALMNNGVAPVPRARYQWIIGTIPLRRRGPHASAGFIDKRG